MPELLVSVRNASEAAAALAGGADWIDLKEPAHGALGCVGAETARTALRCVPANVPLSAAAGELTDWPYAAARDLLQIAGIAYFKLGLAGCKQTPWRAHWSIAQQEIAAAGAELIAVIYADAMTADAPPPGDVLQHAAESKSPWLLFDTFDKSRGTIVDSLAPMVLRDLLVNARHAGMKTAVAGGLTVSTLDRLPLELIDMIAVRGAACRSGRESSVDERSVRLLRQTISLCELAAAGRATE